MVLNVGIIGTGFAKSVQIPGFQNSEEFEVVALYGRTNSKTMDIANEYDIETVHENWEDLVANPNIDVVSVVSPVHQHYGMAISAILNNKHILSEKPMSLDVSEAYEMQQELAHSGLIGMINHEFRQLPERRYFHDLVLEGDLGNIYEVNIDLSSPGRLPQNTTDRKWNWWADIHHGGGLWGAIGSHLIDFILWTFGAIDMITGNLSTNNQYLTDKVTEQSRLVTSDDSFHSLFTTTNGIKGRLTGSTTRHGDSGTVIEAFGSKSSLRIDRDRNVWKAEGSEWEQLDIPKKYLLRKTDEGESWLIPPFELLIDQLAEGIKSGYNPSPSFEDGLNVQYVLDALRECHLNQKWATI